MTTFIIILILALITWYIAKAQLNLPAKMPNTIKQSTISKDQFLYGLENGKIVHPLLGKLAESLSLHIHDSNNLIHTALIALVSNGHVIIQ